MTAALFLSRVESTTQLKFLPVYACLFFVRSIGFFISLLHSFFLSFVICLAHANNEFCLYITALFSLFVTSQVYSTFFSLVTSQVCSTVFSLVTSQVYNSLLFL